MKKSVLILISMLFVPVMSFAGSYETLSSKLVEAGAGLKGQKLVIIPFKTGSGLPENAGSAAAHKLNIKLTQELYYDVASAREFAEADSWVTENGDPKKNSALQLMERLNARLAVTGTVRKKSDSIVEIKVKLIKPMDKKTLASISEEVNNEWASYEEKQESDSVGYSPVPEHNVQPAGTSYSQNYAPAANSDNTVSPASTYSSNNYNRSFSSRNDDYVFLDLFYGLTNSAEMNMEFKNDTHYVNAANFTRGSISGTYSKFELKWAKTDGKGPIGLRFGFFDDILGFDFGLRYHSYETKHQNVKTNLVVQNTYDMPDKYAKMSIYEMNGDLLLRFIKTNVADAYIGLGIGMNLMRLELPYVKDSSNKPTDEIGLGMSFRIPLGVRWKMTDSIHLVTEVSYEASTNMTEFSRGYTNEKDSFILSGFQSLAGISFVF